MSVVSTLEVLINGNNAGLSSALRDSASALERFGRGVGSKLSSIGRDMQGLGVQISALTAPLVAFGVQGIKVASDFESAMAEIQARTGATDEAMETVRQTALQMGADTSFSAQDAAAGFLQLLSSGQSLEEAMSTLPAVLDAAAASGEDLGRTADGITDIMAAFRLPVTQARSVVDALSRAAGSSSATMADLTEGFQNVGGVANQFGLTVDDTAAILAIFAENGIKGSEAGTQLRSMLNNMSRDTDEVNDAWEKLGTSMFDATGAARPLDDVMADITRGLEGMTDEERISIMQALAGTYGQLGLAALTSGMNIDTMKDSMAKQASASDVATARTDTFAGRVEALQGSIETLQIEALTPLMEKTLKPLIEQLIDTTNKVTDWTEANPEATTSIIGLVAGTALLGAGLFIVGTVISAVGTIVSAFATVVGLASSAVTWLLSGALLPILPVLALIGGMFYAYQNNILGFRDRIDELRETMDKAWDSANKLLVIISKLGLGGTIDALANETSTSPGTPNSSEYYSYHFPSGIKGDAIGGAVMGNTPYLVGERGPELFMPGRSGSIVANDQLFGGQGLRIDQMIIQMPAEALRDRQTAQQRGDDFGTAFMERVRSRG